MQRITDSSSQSTHIKFENENTVNQNARAIATSILEDIIAGIPTRAASPLNERAAIGVPQEVLFKQVIDSLEREEIVVDYSLIIPQIKDLDPLHEFFEKETKDKARYNFDTPRIIDILKEMVKRGHAESMHTLGACYECGCVDRVDLDATFDYEKRNRDLKKAFELYQKAHELGSKTATASLGVAHCFGLGTPADAEKGKQYVREAEENQAKGVYAFLGYCYTEGMYKHKKDLSRAFSCYMNAHKNGSGDQAGLEFCFQALMKGFGVVRRDPKAAIELIENAHSEGNIFGTCILGIQYFNGNPALGISKDKEKGIHLLEQAAGQGNSKAICDLYAIFSDGNYPERFNLERAANYLKNGLVYCHHQVNHMWLTYNLYVKKMSYKATVKEDIPLCVKRYIDLYSVPPVSVFELGAQLLEMGYIKEAHQMYNRGLMRPLDDATLNAEWRRSYNKAIARFNDEKKAVITRLDALQSKTSASYDHFIAAIDHLIDLHSVPQIVSRVRFKTEHVSIAEQEQLEELKKRLTQELTNALHLDPEITASVQKLKTIPNTSEKSFNEFKTKIQYYKDRPFSLDEETEKKLERYEGSLTMILKMAQSYSQEKKIEGLVAQCQEEWNTQSSQIVQESKGKELDELVRSWDGKIQTQAEIKTALLQDTISALRESLSSKQQEIQKINRLLVEYNQRAAQIQTSSNQDITSLVQEFNDQNQLLLQALEPSISPSSGPDYKEVSENLQKEVRLVQAELKEALAQLETSERETKSAQSRMFNRHEQEIGSLESKLKLEADKNQRLAQQLEPYLKIEREQQTTTSIPVLVERVNHRIDELLEYGVTRIRGFDVQKLPGKITGDYAIKVYKDLGFTYRPPGDHHNFDRGQGDKHIKFTMVAHDLDHELNDAAKQELLNTLLSDLRLK